MQGIWLKTLAGIIISGLLGAAIFYAGPRWVFPWFDSLPIIVQMAILLPIPLIGLFAFFQGIASGMREASGERDTAAEATQPRSSK